MKVPETMEELVGEWRKAYVLENGAKKDNARWVLKVIFKPNEEIIYKSEHIGNIKLVPIGDNRNRIETNSKEVTLKGFYRLEDQRLIITFFKLMSNREEQSVIRNLGYDPQARRAVVKVLIKDQGLILQGQDGDRVLFFKKIEN